MTCHRRSRLNFIVPFLGFAAVGGLALTGCFANGSVGGSVDRPDSGVPSGTDGGPTAGLDGAALYESKGCVGCHGPLATSQKRNATFERIRAAAGPSSQIAPMRNIQLTDEEIRALVVALADPTTPGAPDGRRALAKPLLLTRSEIGTRLYSIFRPIGNDDQQEENVQETIAVNIYTRAGFIGGHCNIYDGCSAEDISATQNPATSTVRAGVLIRTCLDLLAMPSATASVLAKVGLTPASPANPANIRAVWDVFAPGRPLDDANLTPVAEVAAAAPGEAWSTVLRLFCRPTVLEAI